MYCKKCGTYNSSESLICEKCKDNLVNQYLNDGNKEDSSNVEDNLVNNKSNKVINDKIDNSSKNNKKNQKKKKNQRKKESKKKRGKLGKILFKRNNKSKEKKYNKERDRNSEDNGDNSNSCMTSLVIIFLVFVIFVLSIYILKLKITIVPDVVNLNIDDAIVLLEERDLNYDIITEVVADDSDNNVVLFQDRDADKYILRGSTIILTVGSIDEEDGSELVYLDSYIGMDSDDAINLIEDMGLSYSVVMENSSEKNGIVINQSPSANEEVTKDTIVILYVSVNEEEFFDDGVSDDS